MRPIKVRLILPLPSFILEILQSRISSLFGFRVANLIRNYLMFLKILLPTQQGAVIVEP